MHAECEGGVYRVMGGGPLITNWIRWYGTPWKDALDAVMSIHPHIRDIDERNWARSRAAWVRKARPA